MKRRSFNMESVKELLNSDIYKGIFLLIFLIKIVEIKRNMVLNMHYIL